MNRYVTKKMFVIINVFLFFIEFVMLYLIIKSILTKDLISPNDVTFYEYLRVKLSNLI